MTALPPVIAQEYSSTTFVSLRLRSRKATFGDRLKLLLLQLFSYFLKVA
jgi:hypothetical protein